MVRTLALIGAIAFSFQAQGDAKKEVVEKKLDGSTTVAPAPPPSAGTRETQVALIRARYGVLLRDPAVLAELRLHARRVARLDAMERVATSAGKAALLTRIADLRQREDARLEKRITFLKEQAAK